MKAVAPAALVLVMTLAAAAPAAADELSDLVNKADRVYQSKTSASVLEMEIQTARYQRRYKIVAWERGDTQVLIKILGPARWRGHGTLKIGGQLKLYDPRTNQITVVGSSLLGDAWMGSHFTNDDLVRETRLARDFDVTLVRKWQGKAEDGRAVTFHRARLTPRPRAPVAWGKIEYELWEASDAVIPVRADYYRKAGDTTPTRSLVFSGLRQLGGRLLPATMTATVAAKPGEHTSVTYTRLQLDVAIPDSKFTEQALRK